MSGRSKNVCASAAGLLLVLSVGMTGCGTDAGGGAAGAGTPQFIPVAGEAVAGSSGSGVVAAGTGAVGAAGAAVAGMGAAGMAAPTGAPTWSAVYAEIITGTGCNGGFACHAGSVGNLTMKSSMEAYTALVGVSAMGMSLMPELPNCKDSGLTRVVASDPDNSLLVQKLEQEKPACGARMPFSKPLPPAQIQQIRTWITNGARND